MSSEWLRQLGHFDHYVVVFWGEVGNLGGSASTVVILTVGCSLCRSRCLNWGFGISYHCEGAIFEGD